MIQLLTLMVILVLAGMILTKVKDQVDAMVTITMMILMLRHNAVYVAADRLVAEMLMLVITLNLLL